MTDRADANYEAILNSSSLVLAEQDTAFLARPELRAVRMQIELLKPEMALAEHQIRSTIVVFGGNKIRGRPEAEANLQLAQRAAADDPANPALARAVARCQRLLAKCRYYDEAREFARLISTLGQSAQPRHYVVVTGGGPGIMEAANRGAFDVDAKSIGLNIRLPAEQTPNPYITPELCFQFHYFALRKLHFLLRAIALVVFPGGFGTIDELFDALTLRQTNRMQTIPIILYSREYWSRVVDFNFLADEGVIEDQHLSLLTYAESPQEIVDILVKGARGPTPK
jgi:uncharacterized protein (TIGR00730 family)